MDAFPGRQQLPGTDPDCHDLPPHPHFEDEDDEDDQMQAQNAPPVIRSESKPRLSKEAQETLEAYFRQQQKPTTAQKKGFAADLGVPLEKINNWFQNRRAKVKQDLKKQQQNQEYYKALYGMHTRPPPMGGDNAYVHPSFYQNMPAGPHPPPPMPTAMPMPDQFHPAQQFQFPPQHHQMPLPQPPPPPPHHPHQTHSIDAQIAHPMPTPTYGSDPVFQSFFGLMDPHAGDVHDMDFSGLRAYGKSFQPPQEPWDQFTAPPSAGLDGYATSTSASMFTGSSGDDASMQFSSSDASSMHFPRHPSSSVNSINPAGVGSSRNTSMSWSQHMRMGSQQSGEHGGGPPGMHQPSLNIGIPPQMNQQVPMEPAPNFDALQPGSQAPESLLPAHLEDVSEEEPMEHFSATSITSSRDVNSVSRSSPGDQVSINSGSDDAGVSPTNTIMKRPSSTTSSLAARRQRRPAALGITTLRSSSHSAAVPPSPGSAGLKTPNDPHLRRIKSSTGVLSGRVQKSAASSAPRSPMHFSEVAQSPNLVRHFSTSSVPVNNDASDDQKHLNKDPLTPLSPQPSSTIQSSLPSATLPVTEMGNEVLENIWNYMPSTSTSTVFSFATGPTAGESGYQYSSPPATPMDPQALANLRIRNNSVPHFFPIPPNSAPAWQTSFSKPDAMNIDAPSMAPLLAGQQSQSQAPSHLSHPGHMFPAQAGASEMTTGGTPDNRRMSDVHMTDANVPHQMGFGVPAIHASSDIPSGNSRQQVQAQPQQQAQPQASQNLHSAQGHHYSQSPSSIDMPPPSHMIVPSSMPQTPGRQDLTIQEFVPRDLADASGLPPRLTPSSARSSKNYQFNNSFSQDYNALI